MKKILRLLGIIILSTASTTNVVACHRPADTEFTEVGGITSSSKVNAYS